MKKTNGNFLVPPVPQRNERIFISPKFGDFKWFISHKINTTLLRGEQLSKNQKS
ncbi:MAG: Unknown protein [uncultured Aureispira sp.]|uniref:Uncharacterized protein n=1 Tax=uncultured Aureispira sp. TaxID=1331704 RepID=A0A6S6SLC1_9BACT|nr:MAG: Unknown protein [uncultured Aureispira sp.]